MIAHRATILLAALGLPGFITLSACSGRTPPDGGCTDVGCADVAVIDGGTDAATDVDTDALPATNRPFGAPCMEASQCASNVCISTGRCSRACRSRDDCPAGATWSCLSLPLVGTTCDCTPRGPIEIACNGIDDDCDGRIDDASRDCGGRCVDIGNDAMNCGACGVVCGGGTVCRGGMCACPPDRTTICGTSCANLMTDPAHCGRCRNACPTGPHATGSCAMGMCSFACEANYADCNGMMTDGCEALLTSPFNCGMCGRSCVAPNSTTVCVMGACRISSCDPGFTDCDGMASNGCEFDTRADAGPCVSSCPMGFADCDSDPRNACETDVLSSPTNCGACGVTCASGMSCSRGMCATTMCTPPMTLCAMTCTDLRTDARNCGMCGRACPAGRTCASSACM